MKIATLLSYLFFPSRLVFKSKYHKNIRVGYSYGHMTLFTGDISQSGGEYVSMWGKAVNYADEKNHSVMNCLMLGVGGGTVAGIELLLFGLNLGNWEQPIHLLKIKEHWKNCKMLLHKDKPTSL